MIKQLTLVLSILALAATIASAQSATFTFGAINPPPYPYPPQQCAVATFDDGLTGSICLAIYPYGWTNIYTPQAYGFPNGGFLTECKTTPSPIGFGGPGFVDNGNGTGTQPFTANNCYDGLNTTISAIVQWKRVSHLSCGHGHCQTFYSWVVNSGSGTVTN